MCPAAEQKSDRWLALLCLPSLPHPRSFQWREQCNKCHTPKSDEAQTVTATVVGGGGLAPSREGEGAPSPRKHTSHFLGSSGVCARVGFSWARVRVRPTLNQPSQALGLTVRAQSQVGAPSGER